MDDGIVTHRHIEILADDGKRRLGPRPGLVRLRKEIRGVDPLFSHTRHMHPQVARDREHPHVRLERHDGGQKDRVRAPDASAFRGNIRAEKKDIDPQGGKEISNNDEQKDGQEAATLPPPFSGGSGGNCLKLTQALCGSGIFEHGGRFYKHDLNSV